MAAMAPRQIMNEWTTDPSEILETFAAEMRANQRHYSIYGGNYAIVIPKQLREHIQGCGLDQARYRRVRLRARAHPPRRVGRCRQGRGGARPRRKHLHGARIAGSSSGGGRWRAGGRLRCVIPPWMGSKTKAVTAAIGACVDCEPPKALASNSCLPRPLFGVQHMIVRVLDPPTK